MISAISVKDRLKNRAVASGKTMQEMLMLSDEQLISFVEDFESRLPEHLKNALHCNQKVA